MGCDCLCHRNGARYIGGGWRIIRTMGHQIIRLEPVHGFAAETSASITIFWLAIWVCGQHNARDLRQIVGVGAAKRINAVRWTTAQRMVIAWVLTLPTAAAIAAMTYALLRILITP